MSDRSAVLRNPRRSPATGPTLVFALALVTVAGCLAIVAPAAAQDREPPKTDGRAWTSRAVFVADSLRAPPLSVHPDSLGHDVVVAAPGATYSTSGLGRFLFGDLHRDLWEIEFPVPVLDLDRVGGGLVVEELSGGKQTLGLHFESRDGRRFQFRSIVKDAVRALPPALRRTPMAALGDDQMGALFPLSALVVAELAEAAGILVAKPRIVIMPDDPRLGVYRATFAGRMGWIEERPNEGEGDTPGFAGSSKITGTEELNEELAENPRSYVNARAFLQARLIDMLVGDWDRHRDQWRWASYDEGERTRWDPIPRDRDWALSRVDGVFASLTRIYSPKYIAFDDEPPDPFRLSWSAQILDRRWLTSLSRSEFISVAENLRSRLDDAAIERAVGVLPGEYRAEIGPWLTRALVVRRDALVDVAERFYELLAEQPNVFATDEAEVLTVDPVGPTSMRVTLRATGEDGIVTFERVLHQEETREIRIYLEGGDDEVRIRGERLPIDVRIVGGPGDDRYLDETGDGQGIHVYDHEGRNRYEVGPEAYVTESPHDGQEEQPRPYWVWERRDWGYSWVPRPEVRYASDMGLYLGAGISRYGFGFGRAPYRSKYSASVASGLAPDEWIGDLEIERPFGDRGWWGAFDIDWATQEPTWFHGFGNETTVFVDQAFHRAHRNHADVWLRARWAPDSVFEASFGPAGTFQGPIHGEGTVFDTLTAYGTDRFHQIGARARVRYDSRDHYDLPTRGLVLQVDGRAFPPLIEVEELWAGVRAESRAYVSADLPGAPTLHARLVGERVWGRTPFADLPYLGGSHTLPGYVRRRFLGETAVAGTALLRWRVVPVRVVADLNIGVHGVAAVGRVWHRDEDSDAWHPAFGGGLWINVPELERTLSLTYVRGTGGSGALYADLGFLF